MSFGSPWALTPYIDRSLGGPACLRRNPFQPDSDSEDFSTHRHRRTSSPPSTAPRLRHPHIESRKNLGWSIEWAVAFLVDFLDEKNSPGAANALRNIRIRAATLLEDGLAAEIPLRIFNKLDETLFAGHLKNAVLLDVGSLGQHVSGATYTQGEGTDPTLKRTSIILNRDVLQHARARDIVATLIHHMIHAYFLVACGPQREEEVKYGRLDHAKHFGMILMTIKKLSAAHGKVLKALSFGHNLGPSRYLEDDYTYLGSNSFHSQREAWHHSHCSFSIPSIPDSDLDEWYTKTCKPLFDLPKSVRSSTVQVYNDRKHELETVPRGSKKSTPISKSLEFVFKKTKPILIPIEKLNDGALLSIRKAFEQTNSRYVEIHKDVSEKTFHHLLEFIHTGSYRPNVASYAGLAGAAGGRKAPPILRPSLANGTDACLLHDIQFYKMGCRMDFSEVKSYALARINSYGFMSEDPIAMLKELYTGSEPDADLRAWARKFLLRGPSEWAGECGVDNEPPNLVKLESDKWPYRTRLYELLESCGALENEVSKARMELKAQGWYGAQMPIMQGFVPAPPPAAPLALPPWGTTSYTHTAPALIGTPTQALGPAPLAAYGRPAPGPAAAWQWPAMVPSEGLRKSQAGVVTDVYGRGLGYGEYVGERRWGY